MAKTVEAAFSELLARQKLTSNQEETAKARVESLRAFFDKTFTMAATPFAIGSYARGTLCASERDIDLLAPFSVSEYWKRYQSDSRAFLYWVRNTLNDRYAATKVSSREVAVRLDFTIIATDIVPCFPRQGGGYLMPNGSGGWMATNPPFHTNFIAQADTAKNGRLRPLIKLIKAWNIANSHHLSSFHVELLVERMKRQYAVGAWPVEVSAVLETMAGWVRKSFSDPWPDGSRIDGYLSADARAQVVRMLEDDAKAAAAAEQYRAKGKIEAAFERWNVIYRHTFPSYG